MVSRYFREHRELGHADLVSSPKRCLPCCAAGAAGSPLGEPDSSWRMLAVALVVASAGTVASSKAASAGERGRLLGEVGIRSGDLPPERAPISADWLLSRWCGSSAEETLASALNQPAPRDLRVNDLKAGTAGHRPLLVADGIGARRGVFALGDPPRDKPALARHPFSRRRFEVQDEGSQLLGSCWPNGRNGWWDFCAGAGGQDPAPSAPSMKNTGRLTPP